MAEETPREATQWPRERVRETALRICSPSDLHGVLEDAASVAARPDDVRDIIRQGAAGLGVSAHQAASLLLTEDPRIRAEVAAAARKVHESTYGRRIGLNAPVCPTSRCVNDCLYCPLRASDAALRRRSATVRELQREVAAVLQEGYRRLELVFGEDRSGVHYVRDMVTIAYGTRAGMHRIECVDVNLNPVRQSELPELAETLKCGISHVYQETYEPETYAKLHPVGPKSDYEWRLTYHDRSLAAGVRSVGLGVLLGAYDHRFDVPALIGHARHLADEFGVPPSSVTYPRMIATRGAPVTVDPRWAVSDDEFCHIVAVTRLALPYVDIRLCTPVEHDARRVLFQSGVSSVSVGSESYPGFYTSGGAPEAAGRLSIGRPRALEELVWHLCEVGFVPDLVVHRSGHAGQGAHERATANALLALKEYLLDHASPETQTVGERLIQSELGRLPERLRAVTIDLIEEIEAGLRRQTVPVARDG